MLTPFFTGNGDSGDTGILGKGRVSKASSRIEAVGSVDEASAALGIVRAQTTTNRLSSMILHVQKKLYVLMTELSADPETAEKFPKIDREDIQWLEAQIESLKSVVDLPRNFIIPGESPVGAALAFARTVIRRAERKTISFLEETQTHKPDLTAYLNRLSSLVFIMEVYQSSINGRGIRLAKEE